ncbi:methylated-DNA--[protein]-cysteine S-methyltransferase [Enterococcus columbae]|uniref:methylated-DNA--[protein]-cysteine S-methyltransferase n=1 Tax=Enterococcus columbae DSM 7374 = ATCC 51263 TaxID=1121865 RepID=S0KXV4_9ENTE|nr:methylated-DNA--[protein]-cysteine S-methyltransferase [Enterococcus columbae]EOT44908.1 hypothetical protein OMW_00094 [Enterococcus columbae DSM 7374 = ATCC 51263]EOW84201.1 hypothetical protein I568_00688 [Enterococcus columbae DSM 7374 = ATCC 51263]OJG24953.1 hypothetical protein RR47_GL002047 [Enterococcus columbae DSM 7374 = ATCC 51263]
MQSKEPIYVQDFQISSLQLTLGVSEHGLLFLAPSDQLVKEKQQYLWQQDLEKTAPYVAEFSRLLSHEKNSFDYPLDLRGTAFQQRVWQELQKIPFGQTLSYSQIAQNLGKPTAFRAVANAIGKNPIFFIIPCHRVIGKNGQLTGFGWGLPLKAQILQYEQMKLGHAAN